MAHALAFARRRHHLLRTRRASSGRIVRVDHRRARCKNPCRRPFCSAPGRVHVRRAATDPPRS